MLRRIWIIALFCANVSEGIRLTVKDQEAKFLQLQVKIEFSITIQREEIYQEVNKLDAVLDHFHHILEKRAEGLKEVIAQRKLETRALNRSINHCIKGIQFLSKNLDLYSLHQCKKSPCHIIDHDFLEAKKLSMSITQKRTNCILKYSNDLKKLRLCFEKALCELNSKQLRIFRTIKVKKNAVVANGLTCIQDNYNILIREICILGCHFEKCVSKECNTWRGKLVLDKPPLPHQLIGS